MPVRLKRFGAILSLVTVAGGCLIAPMAHSGNHVLVFLAAQAGGPTGATGSARAAGSDGVVTSGARIDNPSSVIAIHDLQCTLCSVSSLDGLASGVSVADPEQLGIDRMLPRRATPLRGISIRPIRGPPVCG